MKITGPGSGVPSESVGGPEATEKAGSKFAEKAGTLGIAGVPASDPTTTNRVAAGLTADIGADLQAGRISADTALQRVVDRVIDRQIGVNAPAALREQLETALRQTLEDDPMLADKIRALAPER